MAKRSAARRAAALRAVIAPTRERWARGDVEAPTQMIADEDGRPAAPFRTVDTLMAMERRGTITPEMHRAGDAFRALFALASLDPLRAADLNRVPQGPRELPLSLRQATARKQVWQVLKALGGHASPAGSCVWHVVGCEQSLKDWALREGWGGRAVSEKTAAGILVAALGMLAAEFGE
jgi:hypothetical protein